MLHDLHRMLAPPVMERVTLLLNHVLGSESVAMQRLLPHAGKTLQIEASGWPTLLPPLLPLAWRITPAGLLEWCGADVPVHAELCLRVNAANPLRLALDLAGGQRPEVEITGDAAFAAEVDWLMQNLRWDLAADLERVLPLPLAAALVRAGSALAQAVAAARQGLGSWRERWPGRPGA